MAGSAPKMPFTSLELCAGAGGQAIGLEEAGFHHVGLIEIEKHFCATLEANRKDWNVIQHDLLMPFDGKPYRGIDLLSGGLPCPPFSVAGKQLGAKDERNLFPAAMKLVEQIKPRAVMFENVRGFMNPVFADFWANLQRQFDELGYKSDRTLVNASDFGVPQLRPRMIIVALRKKYWKNFQFPTPPKTRPKTVGEALYKLMKERGWKGVDAWKERANAIAPTIVGGSKKHGGPDLGPTRAKKAWAVLGVDGMGIANQAPDPDFVGMPRLTVPMVAKLQGFPKWEFAGGKTSSYRQVGNAFPPPVARAFGIEIAKALAAESQSAGEVIELPRKKSAA